MYTVLRRPIRPVDQFGSKRQKVKDLANGIIDDVYHLGKLTDEPTGRDKIQEERLLRRFHDELTEIRKRTAKLKFDFNIG